MHHHRLCRVRCLATQNISLLLYSRSPLTLSLRLRFLRLAARASAVIISQHIQYRKMISNIKFNERVGCLRQGTQIMITFMASAPFLALSLCLPDAESLALSVFRGFDFSRAFYVFSCIPFWARSIGYYCESARTRATELGHKRISVARTFVWQGRVESSRDISSNSMHQTRAMFLLHCKHIDTVRRWATHTHTRVRARPRNTHTGELHENRTNEILLINKIHKVEILSI